MTPQTPSTSPRLRANATCISFNPHAILQVDANIQSDDLRHRVQQLELKLFGTSVDLSHAASATELGSSSRRAGSPHYRSHAGLAVMDRLDQLDRDVDGVTQVANKAKVCVCRVPHLDPVDSLSTHTLSSCLTVVSCDYKTASLNTAQLTVSLGLLPSS